MVIEDPVEELEVKIRYLSHTYNIQMKGTQKRDVDGVAWIRSRFKRTRYRNTVELAYMYGSINQYVMSLRKQAYQRKTKVPPQLVLTIAALERHMTNLVDLVW